MLRFLHLGAGIIGASDSAVSHGSTEERSTSAVGRDTVHMHVYLSALKRSQKLSDEYNRSVSHAAFRTAKAALVEPEK
jgi:hypothetical protein